MQIGYFKNGLLEGYGYHVQGETSKKNVDYEGAEAQEGLFKQNQLITGNEDIPENDQVDFSKYIANNIF